MLIVAINLQRQAKCGWRIWFFRQKFWKRFLIVTNCSFPVTFESSYAEASWALRYRSTVSWDWSLSFLAPQGFSCLPTRKVKWNYTNDKSYSYLILETIVHQKNMFYISLFMYHTSLSFYRHQSSKITLNWVFDSISSFTKFRAVQA